MNVSLFRILALAGATLFWLQSVPSFAQELTELAEQLESSVVVLEVSDARGGSTGTGFFISANGQIATNYHVIDDAERIVARAQNGSTFRIDSILATDEENDLAIVQAEPGEYAALRLGRAKAKTGERIVVYGNPLGLDFSLSEGIVSAVRSANDLSRGSPSVAHLQISAPVSSGSSGSPVMNLSGDVIGVVTSMSGYREAENMNFATPTEFLSQLQIHAERNPEGEPLGNRIAWQGGLINLALSIVFFFLIYRFVIQDRRMRLR